MATHIFLNKYLNEFLVLRIRDAIKVLKADD